MGSSPQLWFFDAKLRLLDQNNKSQLVPALICGFWMHNSAFWTRITSLYGSLTSSVVLCMLKSGPSINITRLYGSQHSSVVFGSKITTFGQELQVSKGPRPHLWFCAFKTPRFEPELQVSVFPRPHLSFCASKTVCLASELLDSMGPSPHLCFLDAKQRLLDQNNKSLWVPYITCHFVHEK